MPGLEIQALYGYRACNIFSFKGMKEIKRFNPEVIHVQTEFGIGIFGRIAAGYSGTGSGGRRCQIFLLFIRIILCGQIIHIILIQSILKQ